MISSDKVAIFTIAFGAIYAVIYMICAEANLPLLTYHPVIGELDLLWTPEKRGPAMYWYGWMLTALIGASAVAFVATAVPERWLQLATLLCSVAAAAYLIFFSSALFIYDHASTELPWLQSRWLSACLRSRSAYRSSLVSAAPTISAPWPYTTIVPCPAVATGQV